jgi:hypothetical protein
VTAPRLRSGAEGGCVAVAATSGIRLSVGVHASALDADRNR